MSELPSIQQLKNFIIYGKYRNFTAAANAANITQSTFSFQMKKLEELVGIQLIERSNRGSHLTKAGELFFSRMEPLLSDLERCFYDMKEMAGEEQTLSVGIMLSLGDIHMNRHLAYFQEHHAGPSIRVYNLEARELLQQLRDDKVDIISLFDLPDLDTEGLEKVCFCKEHIVYYGPHIDVPDGKVTADFIASQPLAQYSPQYVMNAYLTNYIALHTKKQTKTQAWFSTPYAMMNYCQQNHIGALLPARFLTAMGVGSGYYEVDPPVVLPCCLLYKANNPKKHIVKLFVDYMRQTYHVCPDRKDTQSG